MLFHHFNSEVIYSFLLNYFGLFVRNFFRLFSFLLSKASSYQLANFTNHDYVVDFKLPQHVAFVISEDCIAYYALIDLLECCCLLGIFYVTLYPCKVSMDNFCYELRKELQLRGIALRDIAGGLLISKSANSSLGQKKGSLTVLPLNGDKRTDPVVNSCMNISRLVTDGKMTVNDVTPALVDQAFRDEFGAPDPDIMLLTDHRTDAAGYAPWALRLTEFYRTPKLHDLRPADFVTLLKRFARTEQRIGT